MQTVYYSFQWPYDLIQRTPKKVTILGSFDNWHDNHTMALNEETRKFEVIVPIAGEPGQLIHFKYLVDDQWTTSDLFKTDIDEHGNSNNVITFDQVIQDGKSKKIKIARKYRRNKETGEKVLISKELLELDINNNLIKIIESIDYPSRENSENNSLDNEGTITPDIIEEMKPSLFEIREDTASLS
ncbi:hypothetical protein C6P45_003993 [Maudiozyma exigua]|uniref:AMP-activated protein kinase glycogen-binding domain-containing protein n=1 Tax=Maudiozyma exigua TaxID=34358 RepID=A0A9P6WD91_MAUEX|nr:hypothetical protein C6P45_003993 [Kazachstania exigua]